MASPDIASWADHALILVKHADGYLSALYSLKQLLDLESKQPTDLIVKGGLSDIVFGYGGVPFTIESMARPAVERMTIFIDPTITALQKQVLKKFPDYGDLGKSTPAFQNGYMETIESTKSYFQLLAAVADYLEMCITALKTAGKFTRLNPEFNPDLTNTFLDLFLAVTSIIYLVGSIGPEVKLLAFVHNRAYQTQSGGPNSPGWLNVSKLLTAYQKSSIFLQESLAPIASRIITVIISLRPDVDSQLIATAETLRNAGTFSVVPEMYGITSNPPTNLYLKSISSLMKLFKICTFGVLAAPTEAFQQTASLEILKTVLGYGSVVPLIRNELMNLGTEFEVTSKSKEKIGKLKSIVNEVFSASHSQAIILHRDRRQYIRGQLQQMLALLNNDNILSKKFTTIVAGISFARDEIMWYFVHNDKDPKKKRDSKSIDLIVIDLIYLVCEIANGLLSRREIAQRGIAKHIRALVISQNLPAEIELLMHAPQLPHDSAGLILYGIHSCINSIQNSDIKELAKSGEFEALRLNNIRFQAHASLQQELLQTENYSTIINLMSTVSDLTKWLDMYDEHIAEASSFKCLFFFQTSLQEHIKECFDTQADALRSIGALGSIVTDFSNNLTSIWPAEYNWLNTHTICFATEFYSALGQYTSAVAYDVAMQKIEIQSRTLPRETVAYLPKPSRVVLDAKKKALNRRQASERPLVRPGLESTLKGTDIEVQSFDRLQTLLKNLILAISKQPSIKVQEVEFQPIEFFIDSLANRFRNFLNQAVYRIDLFGKEIVGQNKDDLMSFDAKRPTVLLHEIKSFMMIAKTIDGLAGTDIVAVLRDILIEQSDLEKARAFTSGDAEGFADQIKGRQAREKGKPPVMNVIQPFLVTYMQWYCEFLSSKAATRNTVYSQSRRAFCSISASTVEAQTYTDAHELEALSELIGPQGIQFMDLKLTRQITILCGSIQEMIFQNTEALELISVCWTDESVMKEALRKMRHMRDFITKMISVGIILEFRKLMASSSRHVISTKFPKIEALVVATQHQYGDSCTETDKDFKVLDSLANQIGMRERCDVMLKWALSALTASQTDPAMWRFLPYLFAAALWHTIFDDSVVYISHLDAMENNAHCIMATFSTLTANINSLSNSQELQMASNMHIEFFKVAATLLLCAPQHTSEKDREWQSKSYDTVVLILQQFSSTSPYITADVAERYFPYAMLQLSTTQIFQNRLQLQSSQGLTATGRGDEDPAY
ncbi:hypothetical protein QVD99_001188 [Batrachochytrium dendrobatidis]|nr:hypothetical protein O5D80_001017 [Batrachochytrium dendrobatidis]KAK5672425.1 hypothetical protein QVD99_001188 [Batrachochytrium dendrobatidis]